jgi:hypothetical protein
MFLLSPLLSCDLVGILVGSEAEQPRMPQLPMRGPLDEGDPNDHFWTYPVRAEAGQTCAFRKRRSRHCQCVEPLSKIQQELRIETGPDLPRKDEITAFVVADKQSAQTDSSTLRIGEPANDQFL